MPKDKNGLLDTLVVRERKYNNAKEVPGINGPTLGPNIWDLLKNNWGGNPQVTPRHVPLFYEGDTQNISSAALYSYLDEQGLGPVRAPHPSTLIEAYKGFISMKEYMESIGIVHTLDILLITAPEDYIKNEKGEDCFLRIWRPTAKEAIVNLVPVNQPIIGDTLMMVEKKK